MGAVNKYADENVFRCFDMCDRLENYKSDSELTEERLFVSLAVLKDMAELQDIDEDELLKSFTGKIDYSKLSDASEESVTEYEAKRKKEQKEENARISKNYKAVRRYFYDKNEKEYGIYREVYDELGIDLELKQEDSLAEKLDKLKLLKMICFAEKIGVYESIEYDRYRLPEIKKGKVPIISILKNPKIDIIDGYGYGTDFADEFYIIYKNVRNLIKDADRIEKTIESIHYKWSGLIDFVNQHAAVFKSVSGGAFVIQKFINEDRHKELEKYVSYCRQTSRTVMKMGVMEQFFIKLSTAKVRAELNGLIKLYTYEKSNDSASKKLSQEFVNDYVCDRFYNKYTTIDEFWNIVFGKSEIDHKLKTWKLILFNENPENDLINKMNSPKFKNRCLKLAMLWKMKTSEKNFKMRVDEWCIVSGALREMLDRKDKFETYDKSGYKSYKTFSAAVKSLDSIEKKTRHSDEALRMYLFRRHKQIYTDNDIANRRDSLNKDICILENHVMSCSDPELMSDLNKNLFFYTQLYSVSDEMKCIVYFRAHLKLYLELTLKNIDQQEAASYEISCPNPFVFTLLWGFCYSSIDYEIYDSKEGMETAREKLKVYSEHYESLKNKKNINVYDELSDLIRDLKPYDTASGIGFSDAIVARFADELCREDISDGEIMKFIQTFEESDGSTFEAEVSFSINKTKKTIVIENCIFNGKIFYYMY